MVTDILGMLFEATIASLVSLALVMGLRQAVRRRFGAEAAYALWLLLPLALLAVLLPASGPVLPTSEWSSAIANSMPRIGPAALPASEDGSSYLFGAWLLGAFATAGWLALRQRRFVAGLGPLRPRPDGFSQSLATRGLPAVVGLRPRIVLPGDFEQRYNPIERELVLAHELVHLRRGDVPANLLYELLRVLLWFNPLVHAAAAGFRHDQELSCDALVLRRHPDRRRTYGDAMLKTELADQPLPLGCHWSAAHPLKERLMMLKNPPVSARRRLAGVSLATGLALAVSSLAWATQPAAPVRGDNMAESGIEGEAPDYPKSAADAGQGGLVMLRAFIEVDGKVREVEVDAAKSTVAADSELARSSLEAAAKWKFQPAMENGKPVAGWVLVPVRFDPPAAKPVADEA